MQFKVELGVHPMGRSWNRAIFETIANKVYFRYMKIKSQTDQQMELDDADTWAFILAIVLVMLGLWLAVLSFLGSSAFSIPAFTLFTFGTALFLVRVRVTVIFDKTANKVDIIYKSIIRSRRESHPISEIKGVEFRFVPKPIIGKAISSGGRRTSPTYLALSLSSGRAVVIGDTIWSNPSAMFQPAGKSSWRPQIGQQISVFLGVPYFEQSTKKSDYFSRVIVDEK